MRLLSLVLAAALSLSASVTGALGWEITERRSVRDAPKATNSATEEIIIRCRRDLVIGLVTPSERLLPKRDDADEEGLFDDVFGKVIATIDGEEFALGAGGAGQGASVWLFPREPAAFLAALSKGEAIEIALDVLPEDAKEGAGFETVVELESTGLSAALAQAGPACRTD